MKWSRWPPRSAPSKFNRSFSRCAARIGFLFLPKFCLLCNLQNVHSALKLLPQLVGILRITEQRSRNRCSVHDSSSHQSDTPYTPPWSASTEGHFFIYPTSSRNGYAHLFAPGFPQQSLPAPFFVYPTSSRNGYAHLFAPGFPQQLPPAPFFVYPTGNRNEHAHLFALGFPQQLPPAPFLPTRPAAIPYKRSPKTKQPMDEQHLFLLPIHGLSFYFFCYFAP